MMEFDIDAERYTVDITGTAFQDDARVVSWYALGRLNRTNA
ncbi:MAG: hypothetical protein ACRDUX_07480 [Mycobacterium sp.]